MLFFPFASSSFIGLRSALMTPRTGGGREGRVEVVWATVTSGHTYFPLPLEMEIGSGAEQGCIEGRVIPAPIVGEEGGKVATTSVDFSAGKEGIGTDLCLFTRGTSSSSSSVPSSLKE